MLWNKSFCVAPSWQYSHASIRPVLYSVEIIPYICPKTHTWHQMVHIGMLIYSYYVNIIVHCLKSDGKLEMNIVFCISASRRTSRVW